MVLVLFTLRDRKLRKLGVGRSIETARADAAKQVLRYIKEGEKVILEQSVLHLEHKRKTYTETSRVRPMDQPVYGYRAPDGNHAQEEGSDHGKQRARDMRCLRQSADVQSPH